MSFQGNSAIRRLALASVSGSALVLAIGSAASAQDQEQPIEQVVVSGTRITSAGFDAPTPTTVVGSDIIEKNAASNIFTTITELPSLQGSTGTTTGNNGTSGGTNGLSSFSLRGLGTIRTLVLIDGQRVVPSNVTGIADVSQFPQLLVQRVDVVTGGASASWGSDAVAGVVNFVTDKKFEGFKANLLGGITTYGDDANTTLQLAAGTSFLGGKGHIEAAAEYSYEAGVPAGDYGINNSPNGRDWYKAANILQRSTAQPDPNNPGKYLPLYTYATNTQPASLSKYGLITAGPLAGIAFGANGQPFKFQKGSNCVGAFCIGGDTTGNVGNGTSYVGALTRGDFYTRLSYDVAPGWEIYGTMNLSEVYTANQPNPGARKEAALTIQCGNAAGGANPFLPDSINQACIDDGITSFQYGTANAIFPQNILLKTQRDQRRFVIGTDGVFNAFGTDWTFDSYFQHGENDTSIHVYNISLNPRYNAAIDAVAGPNGTIVCRSAAAQASGCVPLDIIGNVTPTQSQMDYIEPANGPYQLSPQRQEAFAASINGSPVKNWAGDVSLAAGIEYREEAYSVKGDPYGNGVTATNPNTAAYPADPLLSTSGNNWYAGNFHDGSGNYHVYEMFLETVVPLVNDDTFGKADLDLAGRGTRYSTSGDVTTWKVGLTWQTPIDGIKLRAIQSRDVRAPNLSELFAAPIVTHSSVLDRANGNANTGINQEQIGNTDLQPEKAQTTELGVVFQPSWLAGFQASVDYWRVAVKGQINSLTAQQEVDLCYASGGTSPVCNAVNLHPASGTPTVQVQQFNLASTVTDGFDIAASYQFDLEDWGVPGAFNLRGLATHTSKFIQNAGIPNQPIIEFAGANGSSTGVPLWKTLTSQGWDNDTWSFTITERWFSDGVFNKNYIACASACPAPTTQNPTINTNKMDGAFYLDLGGSYNVTDSAQLYFKINNVTNKAPELSPGLAINNNGFNPSLYDTIGRMFRLGVRLNY